MKNKRLLLILAVMSPALWLGGCASKAQRAPSLTAQPSPPPKKGFLESAGDTTWTVVTAPARMVGGTGAKKQAPKEPETYEPADAIIVGRDMGNGGQAAPEVAPATDRATSP